MPVEIVWPAVGATILPNLGGWAGGLITTKNIKPWYESFYEILVLLGSTAVTTVAFFKVNETAGYLLIPYLAWGTLATALNYVVYRDNPAPAIEGKKD